MKLTSLLFALLWTSIVYGQDSSIAKPGTDAANQVSATAGQVPATRSETSSGNMAKIVVFREKAFKGNAIKPPVIYDGFLVADKEGSRIFAGKRENSLIIDAKAGETSYVQLKVVMGAWHGVGEVEQVPEETGKAGSASLARQEPDWARAGKSWLDEHTEPVAINASGTWHGSDWGELVLSQTQGSRELKGRCDKWDINGVASGNHVYLLFSSYGDVAYSATLVATSDKVLDGSYSKGLKAEGSNGKTMHLTKD